MFWLQIDKLLGITAKNVGKPITSFLSMPSQSLDIGMGNYRPQSCSVREMYVGSDLHRLLLLPTKANKPIIVELVVVAMEELTRLAQSREPLWVSNPS